MSNLDIVKEFYAALARNDSAAAQAYLAPDIEWVQAEGWPNSSRHVGPEAVMHEVFDKFHEDWAGWKIKIIEWIDAEDVVVSLGEYLGTSRETGRDMRAAFAHVYDLRDGKITRFRQFADTARVRDALPPHIHTRPF